MNKQSDDNTQFSTGAQRDDRKGKLRMSLMPHKGLDRIMKRYLDGAETYGENNWSKVKIEKNIQYKRADNKVVNPEHRPLNIDYDRYVTIKNDLRKKKYNPKEIFNTGLFNVVDIGFNSLFLKANKDLIILLKEFNLDSSKINNYVKLTEKNILRFFDKKKGAFFSFDLRNKKKYLFLQ